MDSKMKDINMYVQEIIDRYYNSPPKELLEELSHLVDSANENNYCPHCGCTEMLCGHNGVGCEQDTEEED